jgi:hypothetical protein
MPWAANVPASRSEIATPLRVGPLSSVWPGRAEARDAAHDEARVALQQLRRREAERGEHARAEVLHQHVGAGDQPRQHLASLGPREIERERALAAVRTEEEVGVAGRRAGAELAPARRLDAHHVCAVIGEQLRAERAREVAREVDDADAGEGGHGDAR